MGELTEKSKSKPLFLIFLYFFPLLRKKDEMGVKKVKHKHWR